MLDSNLRIQTRLSPHSMRRGSKLSVVMGYLLSQKWQKRVWSEYVFVFSWHEPLPKFAARILFRTQDLSQVKDYCYQSWTKILQNQVSIQDFIFAKEVKMGTYSCVKIYWCITCTGTRLHQWKGATSTRGSCCRSKNDRGRERRGSVWRPNSIRDHKRSPGAACGQGGVPRRIIAKQVRPLSLLLPWIRTAANHNLGTCN